MTINVPKILLTGLPGCGKTTAVVRICAALKHIRLAGFYTEEIRRDNTRIGFRWKRLDGPEGILAGIDIRGKYASGDKFRVGKYRVDIAGFEQSVVPFLEPGRGDVDIFVIDEIGRMECLSQMFVEKVRRLFAADKPVVATVAQKGVGFIAEIKTRPEVSLITLTEGNRESVIEQVVENLSNFCNETEL